MISIPSLVGAPAGVSLAVAPNLARASAAAGGGGGVTPTPAPALALSIPAPSIASNAASGTLVSNISNVPAGATPTVTPNDGRLVIAGDSSVGWKVVVGMSALSAGTVNFSVAATGATGASGVLTVTAAVGPTPDGAEEAVISPAVTFARSTYAQTKTGVVAARQSQMAAGGNGVYWGDLFKMPSTAFPDRIFNYCSTDHDPADGGIYLFVCVGNPKTPANWKRYEDAVSAGWLDDFTTKPSANPIFIGAQSTGNQRQCETPRVRKVGSKFVMTYQLSGITNSRFGGQYRNQATLRALSDDGVNWVKGNNTALLEVPLGAAIGDGHTGYLRWGLNPFPGVINPVTGVKYVYVGYGLIGGSNRSTQAQWGTDDPVAGNWTLITPLHKAAGRASPGGPYDNKFSFNWNTMAMDAIRQTRQGWAVLMTAAQIGSGLATQIGSTYEVLLGDDGITVLGKPQLVIDRGGSGAVDEATASLAAPIVFGDDRIIMYNAATSSDEKTNVMTAGPLRNPQNTWFDPLVPAIPATVTKKTANFKGATSIPAGFEVVTSGTTPPVPTFDANGITIPIDGTQATPSEWVLLESGGFDPATTDYAEIYIKDWLTLAGSPNRDIMLGFTTSKTAKGAMTDAVWLSNGGTTTGFICFDQLVGGTKPLPTAADPYHFGAGGPGGTRDLSRDGAPKRLGLRWFPQRDRMFVLGEGGTEMEEMGTSTGNYAGNLDKTKRWYPVIAFTGRGAAPVSERLSEVTTIIGNTASPAPTGATLGNTSRMTNAGDGNSYTYSAVDLGAVAANRVVAFIVTGSSAGASSNIQASLTLSNGTVIPLSRQHMHVSSYSTTSYGNAALFSAAIPDNVTTGDLNVTVTGTAWSRSGLSVFPMYGVESVAPAYVGGFSTARGTDAQNSVNNMVVNIGSDVGGIAIVGEQVGTNAGTYAWHAAMQTTRRVAPFPVRNTNNFAAIITTGIPSSGTGTLIESGGGSGGIMIAAAWNPAS